MSRQQGWTKNQHDTKYDWKVKANMCVAEQMGCHISGWKQETKNYKWEVQEWCKDGTFGRIKLIKMTCFTSFLN